MEASDIAAEAAKLKEALDFLDGLLETHLPRTVAEAIKNVDSLDVKARGFEFVAGKWYSAEDQKNDRQRAIPAWKVVALVEQIGDTFFNQITDKDEAAKAILGGVFSIAILCFNVGSAIASIMKHLDFLDFDLLKFMLKIFGNVGSLLAAPQLATLVFSIRSYANETANAFRRAALPQRSGPRCYRRKRTRR